jgi:ubiquinone/menaquinone biosynthesis C-methylase UbiE
VTAVTDRTADVAMQARQLFDAKAATWQAKYTPNGRLAGRLTRLASAVTYHLGAGGNVLDLGCGTGELAAAIAAAGMRASGCDISPEMLHRAAAADPTGTVDWVLLDPGWRSLPFESATFNAVVASSVLEYVNDPMAVLRECCRVLQPGGILLCTVPNPHHPLRWLEWLISIAGQESVIRAAGRRWPRLDGYLTYLEISRHRHSSRWWHVAAMQADLHEARYLADPPERSPLRLLSLQRGNSSGEYS